MQFAISAGNCAAGVVYSDMRRRRPDKIKMPRIRERGWKQKQDAGTHPIDNILS